MLQELLEIICTGEFEDNGSLRLRSSTWRDGSMKLAFRVEHRGGLADHCIAADQVMEDGMKNMEVIEVGGGCLS